MNEQTVIRSIGRCLYRFDGIPPIHPREFEIQGYEIEVLYGREWISVVNMDGAMVKLPGNEWRIELWADEPEPATTIENEQGEQPQCKCNPIQPLWDGEGLPPAGAMVLIKHKNATSEWAQPDFHPMEIVCYGNELVIFRDPAGAERYGRLADYEFKPLPTERAIMRKEIAESISDAFGGWGGGLNEELGIGTDFFKLADAILDGKIKHVHVE